MFEFPNGMTLSLSFSSASYATNHHQPLEDLCTNVLTGRNSHIVYEESKEATTVEVAIVSRDDDAKIDTWYDYETLEVSADISRDVAGWISVDEALALIDRVREMAPQGEQHGNQ
jgi:hypothetical protein|tara:strand:+ start:5912 stop:6256 length:345 start_codon:yes stop_codon:yes gene_type:complete